MSHQQIPTPEMDDWQTFLDMELDTDNTASTQGVFLPDYESLLVSQSASITDFSELDDDSLSPFGDGLRAIMLPAASDRSRTPNNSPISSQPVLRSDRCKQTSLKRPLDNEEGSDRKFIGGSCIISLMPLVCCRNDSNTHQAKRVRLHRPIKANSIVHTELSSWVEIKAQLEVCRNTLIQLGAKVDDIIRANQQ